MTAQVIERDKLGVLTKIGQGGQGVVYGAPNVKTKFAASMVYKEYKTQTRAEIDFAALAAMPSLVEDSLSYAEAERLISIAAWPCALVEDAGAPTGFVMPAIPDEFFIAITTAKGVSSTTAEFQHLLNHPSVLAARGIDVDDAQRCTLLRETASALAFLHKHGVCVGDISPKNLLFSLTPHEAIYFIDCDAMRINTVSALRQVETPGWDTPPGEELATIYSDTYKLGLLALRLLAGHQDTKNPQHLPQTTPNLLRQIITDTLTNAPAQRPLPEAWTYVLGHAIEQAQHQKLTATTVAAPVGTPLQPPPTPVVHSRPTRQTAHSQPPVFPAYAGPPVSGPPPVISAPPRSTTKAWPLIALAATVAVVIVLSIVLIHALSRNDSNSSFTAQTATSTSSSYSSSTTYSSSATSSTTPTRTFSMPPGLFRAPDMHGDSSCVNGTPLPNHPGSRAGTGLSSGEDKTSCVFAFTVGQAYWAAYSTPSSQPQEVTAHGSVGCTTIRQSHSNVQCSGDDFVMYCSIEGADDWITCRGGNEAVVYIF
jgi:serine/threonine protein kinase